MECVPWDSRSRVYTMLEFDSNNEGGENSKECVPWDSRSRVYTMLEFDSNNKGG